jgi:predicted extracellular nuclease
VDIVSVVPTLFISEYSEGSSNNKYIEIFNPTAGTVSLDNYRFSMCNNGCDAEGVFDYPNNTFDSGASIAAGEVYVVCHPSASAVISAECDETYNYLSNGDDTFALVEAGGDVIDMVGSMDTTDVGDGWTVAGVANATKDHTLVRKAAIQRGETDWALSAGGNETDSQWVVLNKDEWSYLGSHPHSDL